jgi:hypothetical protein
MIPRMTPHRPPRQTRQQIERELAHQKRNWSRLGADPERIIATMRQRLDDLRGIMDPTHFARVEAKYQKILREFDLMRRKRRRPGDGSMPALVEPPRGPRPLQGGAAAALEFDD